MNVLLKNLSALNNPCLVEKLKQKHNSVWMVDNRGGRSTKLDKSKWRIFI